MRRTKFKNVLSLAIERKRRSLWQRKTEREHVGTLRSRRRKKPSYQIGLLISRDDHYLTTSNKQLLDRLYAGDRVSLSDQVKLVKLIQLLIGARSVTLYTVDPDTDGTDGTPMPHELEVA
jgi:hypothetical protein